MAAEVPLVRHWRRERQPWWHGRVLGNGSHVSSYRESGLDAADIVSVLLLEGLETLVGPMCLRTKKYTRANTEKAA